MEPPSDSFRDSALNVLKSLGAITSNKDNGVLTPLGLSISEFRGD